MNRWFSNIVPTARVLATPHPQPSLLSSRTPPATSPSRNCNRCSRWFPNDESLAEHIRTSPRHHICRTCSNDFESVRLLELHICTRRNVAPPIASNHVHYRNETFTSMDSNSCSYYSSCSCESEYDSASVGRTPASAPIPLPSAVEDDDNSSDDEEIPSHNRDDTQDSSRYFSSIGTAGSYVHTRDISLETVFQLDDNGSAEERGAAYCGRCDRMFRDGDGLHTHMRMNGNHPWYCEICRVDFDSDGELTSHRLSAHVEPEARGTHPSTASNGIPASSPPRGRVIIPRPPVTVPPQVTRSNSAVRTRLSSSPASSAPIAIPMLRRQGSAIPLRRSPTPHPVALSTTPTSRPQVTRTPSVAANTRNGTAHTSITVVHSPDSVLATSPPLASRARPPTPPRAHNVSPAPPITAPVTSLPSAPPPSPVVRPVRARINTEATPTPRAQQPTTVNVSTSPRPSSPPVTRRATPAQTMAITCPLCLDPVNMLTATRCGHVFCKECITMAVTIKPECPVCRTKVRMRHIHPVYLNV